jgi:hypothetical protein
VKFINFFLRWVFVPIVAITVALEIVAAGLWLVNLHSDVAVFAGVVVVSLGFVGGFSFFIWYIGRVIDALSGGNNPFSGV